MGMSCCKDKDNTPKAKCTPHISCQVGCMHASILFSTNPDSSCCYHAYSGTFCTWACTLSARVLRSLDHLAYAR